MLTFAVVVSRSGGPIPGRVLGRLRDRACADVPFEAANHVVWSNDSGTVSFGGWHDASDESSPEHFWHVDHDGLTAFAGHLWPRMDGWRGSGAWAAQLAEHFRRSPRTAGADDLAGIYIAASLRRQGRCSVGADPLGIGLAYWGEGRDVIVISTRAALAAGLLASERATEPKRDTIGAGWIVYGIRALGLQTGFEQISVLPQGALVDIDPRGGVRLRQWSSPPWRPGPGDTTAPEEALERARQEMSAFLRMALASPGRPIRAGLTGGKDSRLILALLIADGLADDVEFQTNGQADLPDVVVATQIAESFGLHHVLNPDRAGMREWRQALDAAVRANEHEDLSSREIAFRLTAWLCSGSRNVCDVHLQRPTSDHRALLTGLFGETFRTNFSASTRFHSKQQIAHFPAELGLGTAGILRPEVLAHYRNEAHRLLFDGCLDADSPQDVVDTFFIRNWLRRWFGTVQEIEYQSRLFPLYSITGTRLAFAIGAENRHAEWIHYQLIREACEPLLHVPFADHGWSTAAGSGLRSPQRHNEPAPAPTNGPVAQPPKPSRPKKWERTAGRDLRAKVEAVDLEVMRRLLQGDPSNPLFEIVDPVAVNRALDEYQSLPHAHKQQLYGALTAAIWLGRHEIANPL
jgi:hypothetical protein